MFIGKTQLDKMALVTLGRQLFKTKRTHNNPLIALQYMVDSDCDEYNAIRMRTDFGHIISYTFCWAMSPNMYHKYASNQLKIDIKEVVNDEHQMGFVCFFTGSIYQWVDYCKNDVYAPDLREEVRQCLSEDGYALLFRETKKLR